MTHKEKLNKMFQELPEKGINDFAPLLHRLLWKVGIKIPSPYFSSSIFLFIFYGLFSGISLGLARRWLLRDPPIVTIIISVFMGICYGLPLTIYYRRKAKKHNLPLWKDYGKDEKKEL